MSLPDRSPETITVGQPAPTTDQSRRLIDAAFDELAERATSYHDISPNPVIGSAPPVAQPGRPPMSQKAVDDSTRMLTGSVLVAALGGSGSAILWATGYADPTVVACICAAPVGLAIPFLALSRFMRRAKEVVEAAPPVIHQHYTGPVTQDSRTVHSETRGVWAKTTNKEG